MAKLRITFDVDTIQLFDSVRLFGSDHIGARMIGLMLTGHASFVDRVGMGAYGVTVNKVEAEASSNTMVEIQESN